MRGLDRRTVCGRLAESADIEDKYAFQWDAYCPLVDHIPACTVHGVYVYPSMHWAGGFWLGVSTQRVSAQGVPAWGRTM